MATVLSVTRAWGLDFSDSCCISLKTFMQDLHVLNSAEEMGGGAGGKALDTFSFNLFQPAFTSSFSFLSIDGKGQSWRKN